MVGVSKLDKLTSRERRVYEARVLADNKPLSLEALEALAAEFGVARERVRQLEARALEKMGMDNLGQSEE
jgi:DNA-directed RNA polymerase sigma subunit (sigma70/sigma32)